jgi:tetratricopeptide (TPR) repeat protein
MEIPAEAKFDGLGEDWMSTQAVVWTEGKTDWQHLKRSLYALGAEGRVSFHETETDFGDDALHKQCLASSREPHSLPTIFIFDRDKQDIVSKVNVPDSRFKDWGNNVYSFAIPTPPHRLPDNGVCIELYYTDDELRTTDDHGRRLFLSNEFNSTSGRHITLPTLSCLNRNRLVPQTQQVIKIIDSEVYDEQNKNVALSKADFARLALEGRGAFALLSKETFALVLDIIDEIIDQARPQHSLFFQDLSCFLSTLQQLPPNQQLSRTLAAAIQMARLACTVYIASILRHYEVRIRVEDSADRKKVKPIKLALAQNSLQPSLSSILKLATTAQYIIDSSAPPEVHMLRGIMMSTHVLGPLGSLFNALDKCFPPPRHHGRVVQKHLIQKPILDFVVPEIAKHESRISTIARDEDLSAMLETDTLDICSNAIRHLYSMLAPLETLTFQHRNVENVRNVTGNYDLRKTTFVGGRVNTDIITKTIEDAPQDKLDIFELVTSHEAGTQALDVSPFLILRNDRLFYFNRKTVGGYEYVAPFQFNPIEVPTKRRFDLEALRSASSADNQSFFWAHVEPTVNALNIRANIPGQEKIVGRKQQLLDITQDILLIPNRDGIIYGPGGVGKTALLIELTWQLYDNPSEELTYSNIIWISAKEDYFNPLFDTVEKSKQRITSLDNVLTSILEFHEIEDGGAYSLEEKEWLVSELCRDTKSLIVIDNFETIQGPDQSQIVRFFGTDLKRKLRNSPDHCKVIITSRETIPSGFFQFDLHGLDPDESVELMNRLYQPYTHSRTPMLTQQQMDSLYEATKGVPLLIKHSFGKIYEFGQQLDTVIQNLSGAGNKAIEFSFSEMLGFLQQDDLQLRVLILLQLIGRPLLSRNIGSILGESEEVIGERLTRLSNYHCVFKLIDGQYEKYTIADEAHTFAKRMVLDNSDVSRSIRGLLDHLTFDERMDYSSEEYDASMDFRRYVAEGQFLVAEDFIRDLLISNPTSVLLNITYARYLKEKKGKVQEAIDRLEAVRIKSGHALEVLRLLMKYYSDLAPADYEHADVLASELEPASVTDMGIKFDLAEFYVRWSTSLKVKGELDPIKNMLRTQKYKELAEKAITLLEHTSVITYEKYYLLAAAYHNTWDYPQALKAIDGALRLLPKESKLRESYNIFRSDIVKKGQMYGPKHNHEEY